MNAMDSASDVGAIQQLATLFHSADPAQSGLLSYSEFAYLILKSGGSQEQVDALIDEFSVPSRAQRMVCYAALLQQLDDAVRETAPREQSALLPRPSDTADHSPLPVPPPLPRTQYTSSYGSAPPAMAADAAGVAAAALAERQRRSSSSSTLHTSGAFYSDEGRNDRRNQRRGFSMASSSPPLQRSLTHAGSRDTSVASYEPHPQLRRQPLSSSNAESRASRSLSSGSPQTPFQPSPRFVASALRAAQQQGTPSRSQSNDRSVDGARDGTSGSRSRSTTAPHGYTTFTKPGWNTIVDQYEDRGVDMVRPEVTMHSRVDETLTSSSFRGPAQPPVGSLHSPFSRSHSREDSVLRMTRAAVAAQEPPHQSGGTAQGAAPPSSTREHELNGSFSGNIEAPRAAMQLTNDASLLSSSSTLRNVRRQQGVSRQQDSVLSSASTASKATLLSLRDVFQLYVLPATTTAATPAQTNTVLLSELEDVFAAHGVEVHPLELEAVADSLELQPDATQRSRLSTTAAEDDEAYRFHARAAADASTTSSAAVHQDLSCTTTRTGGADCTLELVDFCVLVSRLRPGLIQHIRSPTTWIRRQDHAADDTKNDGGGEAGTRSANVTSHEVARTRTTAFTAPSYATPQAHTHRRTSNKDNNNSSDDDDDDDDEPSIADVTVSPLTPSTAGATPSSHRTRQDGPPNRRSASAVESRRPLTLRQSSLYSSRDAVRAATRASVEEEEEGDVVTPPTARQLSSDRQFSVQESAQAAALDVSPLQRRSEPQNRYAQPTTASQLRTRSREVPSLTTHERTLRRRTKEPAWHPDLAGRRARIAAAASPSSSARSSRSPASPSQPRSAPRRVSVSIHDSPPSGPWAASQRSTRSPLSSTASPSSPEDSYGGTATNTRAQKRRTTSRLSPRLLDVVQGAASAMLRCCTQWDSHHTGCIPRHAWSQVLRRSCISLTDAELRQVEAWMAQLCRHHATPRGDLYAEVMETVLTAGDTTSRFLRSRRSTGNDNGGNGDDDASPSSAASPASKANRPAAQSPVTPSSASSTSAMTTPAGSPLQQRGEEAEANRRLRDELMTVCGGDTEALQAYVNAFDESHHGYLHEHVWRASLEELFRRTMARAAPSWVLEGCYRLSRRPLDPAVAQEQRAAVSAAEKAARVRARRLPPDRRGVLCDYRYALQELGLDTSSP